MEYITIEDVKGLTIAGYTASEDMGGGLCWSHPNFNICIWATPNWDGEDGSTPFAYDIDGDEHVHILTINVLSGLDKAIQLKLYTDTLNLVMEIAENAAKDLVVSK